MPNKRGNLYGILLLVLMAVVVTGLFTTNSFTTGFAVKSTKCFEGTAFGECSGIKPKYCDNGALKPDCQRCGCNENEACQSDGTCLQKCADETLFGYCSENKPLLCSKGSLLENCFKCGCLPGQTCLNNGACSGSIEAGAGGVGAGAEEKKAIEEKKIDELMLEEKKDPVKEEERQQPETKQAQKKAGFWWNLFCNVFYFNEYDTCIADAIRYQNK